MLAGTRIRLAALVALGGASLLSEAKAGQFACQVPVAVLCQGCAKDVVISLQPGGGCRVSFNPVVGATPPPAGAVSVRIETPSAPPRAPRSAIYRRGRVAIARQSSSHPCFAFNGQQYCE
jgi:hypothetical protein